MTWIRSAIRKPTSMASTFFIARRGRRTRRRFCCFMASPASSHMFRDLIPLLADRFHIIAPDLPGFGQSDMPTREAFNYTFDNIAGVIDRFTEVDRPRALRALRLRLRRADGFPHRGETPRAHHRDHLAEWQRLRRRAERGLEPDPGLLERPFGGQPRGAPHVAQTGNDTLAVYPWRRRYFIGFARWPYA